MIRPHFPRKEPLLFSPRMKLSKRIFLSKKTLPVVCSRRRTARRRSLGSINSSSMRPLGFFLNRCVFDMTRYNYFLWRGCKEQRKRGNFRVCVSFSGGAIYIISRARTTHFTHKIYTQTHFTRAAEKLSSRRPLFDWWGSNEGDFFTQRSTAKKKINLKTLNKPPYEKISKVRRHVFSLFLSLSEKKKSHARHFLLR